MSRALLAAVAALVPLGLAGQKATPLLVAPAAQGVVLRWAWPDGERPTGYLLERRVPGGSWQRITPQPLTRVRDRRQARQMLGDAYDRLESILFPTDPLAELRDPETARSLLLFAAEMEPGLATALALRYDDRDARAGQEYEYRLLALTRAGEREVAVSGLVMAGSYRAAAAPDSLQAIQGRTGVALLWTTRATFSAYNIYRATGRQPALPLNQAPVVAFTLDAGAATAAAPAQYTDPTPRPGDTVWYSVEGIDAFGRPSERSAPVPAVVRDITAPLAPRTAAAAARGDTVVVTWEASPDSDVAAYQLWRAPQREGPFTRAGAPVAASGREARDPGVAAGRLEWYRVTALDRADNEGPPSPLVLIEVPDLVPPPVPDSLAGRADTGRVRIAWKPVAAADLRGYRVYRAVLANGEFELLTAAPTERTAFTDTVPVRASHPFYYRVTAVDSAFNESAPSTVLALAPPDVTPPSAPQIAAVMAGEDLLVIIWLANPELDVTWYMVRMRPHGTVPWVERPESIPATRLADTIAGVPVRRLLDFALVAVDRSGNRSPLSRPVVGEAYHRRPPVPLEVARVTYDERQVALVVEWATPAGDASRVLVLRRDAGGTIARIVGAAEPAARRFVDRTVRRGQRYEYLLRISDRYGNTSDSRRAQGVEPPKPEPRR